MAAIETLFAAVNPSVLHVNELDEVLKKAIRLVASMRSTGTSPRRSLYESIAKAFDRIRESGGGGESIDFDPSDLNTILSRPDEIEALRLRKMDAIRAITKASPILASKISSEIDSVQAK